MEIEGVKASPGDTGAASSRGMGPARTGEEMASERRAKTATAKKRAIVIVDVESGMSVCRGCAKRCSELGC